MPGAFQHGSVQEGVPRAVLDRYEAEPFFGIEPLDGGADNRSSSGDGARRRKARRRSGGSAIARIGEIIIIKSATTWFAEAFTSTQVQKPFVQLDGVRI
jgi:hypothetical protein